jgi:hypothetical protein
VAGPGSIPQGLDGFDGFAGPPAVPLEAVAPDANRRWERAIGIAIATFICLIYLVVNPDRHNFYEHFTWQADAWLQGQIGIEYPVCSASEVNPDCASRVPDGEPFNSYFLDVLPVYDANGVPTGRALIPFPPLPAVVLLPFVAVFGLNTDAQTIAAVLGGIDVWLVWWLIGLLRVRMSVRAAVTVFFGLGTVFFYTSMLGTTWFFAHVIAVGLTVLAVGVALRGDRPAVAEALASVDVLPIDGSPRWRGPLPQVRLWELWVEFWGSLRHRALTLIDPWQFLAGFLLGLACLARLTILFGLPFLAFVGAGWFRSDDEAAVTEGHAGSLRAGTGRTVRRVLSAGLGCAVPLLLLAAYNVGTTGHIFHPAYEYLYQQEAYGYPELGYNPSWSIEDPRYIPQNAALMLAGLPSVMPPCPAGDPRSLFSDTCPIIVPNSIGMSLLLTSPAYLLAIPAVLRIRRSRLIAGAVIAVAAIAVVNLMHFSQGWVQFGYRFANDFVPFALLLVALGLARIGHVRWWPAILIGASILVNAWGVAWGVILGW